MRLRQPAVLATTLALATTLGGCFLLPVGDSEPSSTPSVGASADAAEQRDPEVGDCWTTLNGNWLGWQTWRGDPAVDCEEDHESYTFAVLDPLGEFSEIYQSNGFVIDEPAQVASDSCYGALEDFMGAPVAVQSRMLALYFLPSKAEWKDGARWVRCDLLVIGLGSSAYEQVFAELPDDVSKLVDALEQDSDYFDVCLDTAEGFTGYGPYNSDTAVYSNCAGDPMWRLDGFDVIPEEYNTKYPGDDAMAQYAIDGCLADMSPRQWGYAHFPDGDSWFVGDRSVTCWAYEWEVPEGTAPPV